MASTKKNIYLILVIGLISSLIQAQPSFSKTFDPDIIGPGSTSMLTFSITNVTASGITAMAFVDNLPAGMLIATPAVSSNTCGGSLTATNGGNVISLTNGVLSASSTCTISVNVTSNLIGTNSNTTNNLTSSAGNSGTATDDLIVSSNRPGFTKSFTPATVNLGESSTLTFTINNNVNPNEVTALNFVDNLPTGLIIADPSNANTNCFHPSLPPNLTAVSGSNVISLQSNGVGGFPAVAANSSCTVTVDVVTTGIGNLNNTSEVLNTVVSGIDRESGKASAVLLSSRSDLHIQKTFLNDPIPPGETGELKFTITNFNRNFAATNISFTDNLDAALSNMTAVGLPMNDVCGTGSTLSGSSVLTLSGGNLDPELSCSFTVTVQIPAASSAGTYINTTSIVSATVDGATFNGNIAKANLFVSPVPLLTKSFLNDPVAPGNSVDLEFSITNTSGSGALSNISFTDELTTFLGSPVSATLPPAGNTCNGSGTLTLVSCGTGCETLSFDNGSLAPGATCTFIVSLDIPLDQPGGSFTNTTSAISGTLMGNTVIGNPASDNLLVSSAPQISKEFLSNPILPGSFVDLEFSLNLSGNASTNATSIAFTDDLDAALSGMTLSSINSNDCGGTVTGIGQGTITFSNGVLVPGGSCTISTTLSTPGGAPFGNHTNTTSNLSAIESGVAVMSIPATDDLTISPLIFTKEFIDDPVDAGATTTLRFTLNNTSAQTAVNMSFTDDLEFVLPGLVATGLPISNVCGTGSQLTGTSLLSFSGGNLGPGASCNFSATLQVPIDAPPGSANINRTSVMSSTIGGQAVNGNVATDNLFILTTVPDCSEDILTIDNLILNSTPATTSFHATQILRSDGAVSSNRNLTFKAGQSLELLQPFSIDIGGILTGIIEDCPN